MYQLTRTSKFLTKLLYSPVYRRAHGIDRITSDIARYLSSEDLENHITVALLHYVEDAKGRTHLGVSVLLNSDSNAPGSCIQGDITQGANVAAAMCAKLKLVMFATAPVQYTANLSGLHITSTSHPRA
jgi:hypothetical protein